MGATPLSQYPWVWPQVRTHRLAAGQSRSCWQASASVEKQQDQGDRSTGEMSMHDASSLFAGDGRVSAPASPALPSRRRSVARDSTAERQSSIRSSRSDLLRAGRDGQANEVLRQANVREDAARVVVEVQEGARLQLEHPRPPLAQHGPGAQLLEKRRDARESARPRVPHPCRRSSGVWIVSCARTYVVIALRKPAPGLRRPGLRTR